MKKIKYFLILFLSILFIDSVSAYEYSCGDLTYTDDTIQDLFNEQFTGNSQVDFETYKYLTYSYNNSYCFFYLSDSVGNLNSTTSFLLSHSYYIRIRISDGYIGTGVAKPSTTTYTSTLSQSIGNYDLTDTNNYVSEQELSNINAIFNLSNYMKPEQEKPTLNYKNIIYIPDKQDYKCFVVQNENVIRAYKEIPTTNSTIFYRDYYVNSNYIYKDSSQTFSQYATIPICIDDENISTEIFYRNDFDKILIIIFILSIFWFYIPIKIYCRLFRRFL